MDEPHSQNAICAGREANLKADENKHKRLIKSRRILIAAIYLLSGLWGVRCAFSLERRVDLLFSIAMSTCATWFCITDSRIRGRPLLHSYYWLIFISWPVSVPIYLAFSRDFKKIWRIALYILAWIATVFLAGLVTILIIYSRT